MSHPGNPLITRLLAHATAARAARAASGEGARGDTISVPELADLLDLSPDMLYDAIESGRLESFRPTGKVTENRTKQYRIVKGVTLRSALIYVLENTTGMTDEAMAEVILRVLPQLGRDELLTRIATRIADIRARRGVIDTATVLTQLGAEPRPDFKPAPAPTLRVLPPPHEVQPDLFEKLSA